MSGKTMRISLSQTGTAAFQARSSEGTELILDGSPEIGGAGLGMRPMELLLTSLAGCSAMDVLHILRQQRQPLENLDVQLEGTRKDAVPSPFERIHLVFTVRGDVADNKLQRAVALSVEKYCSVAASLSPEIAVTWEARKG